MCEIDVRHVIYVAVVVLQRYVAHIRMHSNEV